MTDANQLLLKANLKQLRPPTMHAEFETRARQAASANENYEQYLLRLTALEVSARSANVLKARIKQANFPAAKDFDTHDFTAQPSLNKPKILELANGDWIDQHSYCCLVGNSGTGKTHLAIAPAHFLADRIHLQLLKVRNQMIRLFTYRKRSMVQSVLSSGRIMGVPTGAIPQASIGGRRLHKH